ncbi:MAG: hypothetical protein KDA78_00335 [Planctomycetaceae bacterium]|nr:hypothetical protein [Planctomycetaceae bacterium]
MKRHEVLGFVLPESYEWQIECFREERIENEVLLLRENCTQHFVRQQQISVTIQEAVFAHLGYEPESGLKERIETTAAQAVEYFGGDWWKLSLSRGYDRSDAPYVDRENQVPPKSWSSTFVYGLLACCWSGRWDRAESIASWVDDRVARGFTQKTNTDPELTLYLLIASMLRDKPLGCHLDLKKYSPQKLNAWKRCHFELAVAIDDRSDNVPQLIEKAGKQFLRTGLEKVPSFLYWVDVNLALLWAVADRRNLALPVINSKLDAIMPRRETITGNEMFTGKAEASPLLEIDELDEGLMQALADFDGNAVQKLLQSGANPHRQKKWECFNLPKSATPQLLVKALCNIRQGANVKLKSLGKAAQMFIQAAKLSYSGDEIDETIQFFCELLKIPSVEIDSEVTKKIDKDRGLFGEVPANLVTTIREVGPFEGAGIALHLQHVGMFYQAVRQMDDINAVIKDETILHEAIFFAMPEMIQAALHAGAQANIPVTLGVLSSPGITALELAERFADGQPRKDKLDKTVRRILKQLLKEKGEQIVAKNTAEIFQLLKKS